MTCQPGNLSTNHLNATISGNDFSCPVMLLEDHGRYMRRFADCVFPSLFGLCRLAIYPTIAFTAQPQRTGKRMRLTVNIGAHFCRRELFFIWLMLPLSGGVIEKCAAADKDTKKSWAAIVKPLPASLYPGRTGVRPHASPVPESSMLQWPPVLTTSKTHAEVPSRQQESSEATVRTHPQRRPDRKRQYYRNPSAERFDQQIEALANEVNRLKKQLHGPHRESHKTALLDLAFQMTERDPHPLRASPKALALLANAFSKLAKYQEGATALDWIMKAVIHRSQKQQLTKQCGFKAQTLAMVLNSLSQVAGDDADTTRKTLAKEVGSRDFTDTKEWSAQHLAMVTNGLSQVTGDDADTTRKALAKEVGRRDLTDPREWSTQHLAMVTNGLSQVEGDDADTPRKALAKEVGRRDLTNTKEWSAQHLAMVTNGLSQEAGDDTDTTRKALAKEVGRRALAGDLKCWIAQHLAMVTNGLRQVGGDDADTTRKALAKEVGRRALAGDLKCWIAQDLAMVTNGLSLVAGDDADTTRKALAKEVGRRDLTDTKEWSAQHLAMVASGVSHCSHVIGEDVVQASIQAIMNISPTEQDIIMALYALCRLSLSDDQLKLGYFLVKRLCDMSGFIDTDGSLQHSVGDLLWNLAVLDLCAKQNPLVKDDPDTPRFDIFVRPLMDRENIRDLLSHHWQDRFAYIYWAGISNLEIDVSPALSAPEKKVKVSALQNRVFQAVKNALPNQNIVMEVNIEGFPVDILVGKTLCIEVDGPHHYIQDDTMENDELLLAKESGKRRARDRLIDHILKGLGFEVLRISYVETDSVAGLGTFVDRVINAMDEQEMSSQYEGLRVNDLPGACR